MEKTLLTPNPKLIRLYNENYLGVLKAGILRDSSIGELLQSQKETLKGWDPIDGEYLIDLAERILDPDELALQPELFQKVGGRIAPLLKAPRFFKKILPTEARLLLPQLFPRQRLSALISQIIFRSEFTKGDKRYRTDQRDGRLCIFGESTDRLVSLSSLVHELGHCISEIQIPPNDYLRKVISEAYAQTLEEVVISKILEEDDDKAAWKKFQRGIDSLNFYFYLWELSSSERYRSYQQFINPDFFDPHLLVYRETLFTATGYQALYAAASLIRVGVLKRHRL